MSESEIFPDIHPEEIQLEMGFDEIKTLVVQNGFEIVFESTNVWDGRTFWARKHGGRIAMIFSMHGKPDIETTWTIRNLMPDILG